MTGLAYHRDDLIYGRRVGRVTLALVAWRFAGVKHGRGRRRASAASTSGWTDDMAPSFESRKRFTANPNRVPSGERSGTKVGSRDGCVWAIPIVPCGTERSVSPERHRCDVAKPVAHRAAPRDQKRSRRVTQSARSSRARESQRCEATVAESRLKARARTATTDDLVASDSLSARKGGCPPASHDIVCRSAPALRAPLCRYLRRL